MINYRIVRCFVDNSPIARNSRSHFGIHKFELICPFGVPVDVVVDRDWGVAIVAHVIVVCVGVSTKVPLKVDSRIAEVRRECTLETIGLKEMKG